MSYNIHGSVSASGQVDPEATARAIEEQGPDVVILQEVSRGWPIFGSVDVAEWLSRRLRLPYTFEPAADLRFGNALLSRLPILSLQAGPLPFGDGPQHRSYIRVTFDTGAAAGIVVIGTHLQESEGSGTRALQIDRVLDVWGGEAPAVIAGDMNMQPGEPDVSKFLEAGLVSVQDAIGDPCEPTAWEPNPKEPCDRPDWIFATRDMELDDLAIIRTPASDHLPLAVSVRAAETVSTPLSEGGPDHERGPDNLERLGRAGETKWRGFEVIPFQTRLAGVV